MDPGWVKNRIRIRDDQPGSYFRELRNQFFGLKYLNYLMRIRDGKNPDSGSGIATLYIPSFYYGNCTVFPSL
jgi:hypothetical protein